MKKTFIFSFLVLGITSLIAQVVIIRELIISFYGNELFIGIILASWLAWVAIGSLFLGKLFNCLKNVLNVLIFCHLSIPLFFLLELILIRLVRSLISFPGLIPNLLLSTLYALIVTAPLCLILGLQFTIGSRLFAKEDVKVSPALSKAYLYETIGFIIGGLAFSWFLIKLNEFNIAFIIALLNFFVLLLIGHYLLKSKRVFTVVASILLIVVLGVLFTNLPDTLNQKTTAWRYPNQKVKESINTIYGNIAVTQTGSQFNFYESGLILGSTEETFFNEILVHFALLQHQNPQKILLIGGGFNGAINQILKHNPEQIYYVELDPKLIEITQKYLPPDILKAQNSEEVKIIYSDARYFVKNTEETFDVVILNLPDPSTALLNRLYTQEFLTEIKSKIKSDGIMLTYLTSSPNYLSKESENLNASIYKTLKQKFTHVINLPEDNVFYIASDEKLSYNPQDSIGKYQERNIQNQLVNEDYITYRLTNDRVQSTQKILDENLTAKINQDFLPVSYFYTIQFWLSHFHPKLTDLFWLVSKINLWHILIVLALILGVFMALKMVSRRRLSKESLLPIVTIFPEFSMLAIEVILIFLFQIIYGFLYYQIAILITLIFVGLALGTWVGRKIIIRQEIKFKHLITIYLSIAIYFFALSLIIYQFSSILAIKSFFFLLILIVSFLAGLEFPFINKLYLKQKEDAHKRTGIIYSADLIGSCLGALLASIFLIPILGVGQSLLLLGVLNLVGVILIMR